MNVVRKSILFTTLALLTFSTDIDTFLTLPNKLSYYWLPRNCCRRESALLGVAPSWDRRSILQNLMLLTIVLTPVMDSSSSAAVLEDSISQGQGQTGKIQTTKPFAVLEALLPAARVKRLSDRSIVVAAELTSSSANSTLDDNTAIITELQRLLLTKQNFTDASEQQRSRAKIQPAQQYLDAYQLNLK